MEPHQHSPRTSPQEEEPFWLTVPYWIVTTASWIFASQLIPSLTELDDVGKFVGVFGVAAMAPFEVIFFSVYLSKQNRKKGSRLLKDFFDAGSLFLGLLLQDHVEKMAKPGIFLVVAFLLKMLLIVVMSWGIDDFRIIDLFLSILTQAMVFFYRKKQIDLMILIGLIYMILTAVRNGFQEICASLYHFSLYFTTSEQPLPVAQTQGRPVAEAQKRRVAHEQLSHTPQSVSRRTPASRKPPSRLGGKQI